jgi:hypothetical protein
MNVYVVEWQVDEEYHVSHGISGIFLSMEDAVSALEHTEFECFREVPNGMWKLIADNPVEFGTAYPKTKDGKVWEIYGPNGMLVDGNGMDEPEYHITEYEMGQMEVTHE